MLLHHQRKMNAQNLINRLRKSHRKENDSRQVAETTLIMNVGSLDVANNTGT